MVRANLPAWAALVVEAARLPREAGWLSSPSQECPAIEPPAPLECPACVLVCPDGPLWQWGVGLTLAAAGVSGGLYLAGRGYGRPRAAPSRRGGGVVA